MNLPHRLCVQPRTAIVEVVSGDTGDGRVLEAHLADRLSDATRLVTVKGGRLAGVDLAEVTAAGALGAADEERRLAVFPAFEDVGATRLFTHGVEVSTLDEALQLFVLGAHRRGGANPLWLALDGGFCVAGLDAEHLASFGG